MLHVELLRLEQLVDVVDAQPEVLLLVQVVQVGFLSLAQGQKDLLHPDLVLGEHFVHHLVSELIKAVSKKRKEARLQSDIVVKKTQEP